MSTPPKTIEEDALKSAELGEVHGQELCKELLRILTEERDNLKVAIEKQVVATDDPAKDNEQLQQLLSQDQEFTQLESLIVVLEIIIGKRLKSFIALPHDVDGYYLMEGFEHEECRPTALNQHQARWLGLIIAEVMEAIKEQHDHVDVDLPGVDENVTNRPDQIFDISGYWKLFSLLEKASHVKINFKDLGRYPNNTHL